MNKYSSKQIEYFKTGVTHDIDFRLKALRKLKNLILENQEDIIKAVSSDLGRSETEVYTGEIFFVLKEIDLFIKNLKKWSRPKKVKTPILLQPAKSRLLSQPLGTVLIIAPWNYPFQLLIMPLIGAIAAGNCATLKPSEISEETSALISKIINSNFDEGYIQSIEGDAKVAAGLISEKFDHIFYTGSSGIGRKVLAGAAENLTPATLELGGKCPCIVTEDADIALAARRIVWGKFFNAGQTCLAPDYILADKKIVNELYKNIKISIENFYGENPIESPDYGRIINERHFDRIISLIFDNLPENFSGDRDKLYIPPTIIKQADVKDKVMTEEIFGPILPVIEFDNLNDALTIINSFPKPLGLYLFTKSNKTIREVNEKTYSGSLTINDTLFQIASPYLPFGGVGESGMGRYRGKSSFDLFSNKKAFMRRSKFFDFKFRYPPYNIPLEKLKKLLKWL